MNNKFKASGILVLAAIAISLSAAKAYASGESFYAFVVSQKCADAAEKNNAVAAETACTIQLVNTYGELDYKLQFKDGKGEWQSFRKVHTWIDGNGDNRETFRFRVKLSRTYRIVGDLNNNSYPDLESNEFRINVK